MTSKANVVVAAAAAADELRGGDRTLKQKMRLRMDEIIRIDDPLQHLMPFIPRSASNGYQRNALARWCQPNFGACGIEETFLHQMRVKYSGSPGGGGA